MHRIILQEYGTQINIEEIADNCNITAQSMRALLRKANSRIMTALSLRTNPLIMDSDTVRAVNIAGAIRLSAQIELEIMPKYLGFSENDTHWKEDFYLLSHCQSMAGYLRATISILSPRIGARYMILQVGR